MRPELIQNNEEDIIRLTDVSVHFRSPTVPISGLKEYVVRLLQGQIKSKFFSALENVTFSINKGEVFGLIGHNGAGKSTLLKLVARVFRPSSGRIWMKGKIVPLLELGAGFHPELTGRENIFLNGAILGFNRQEMTEKLPGIVDFSELWDFIDAPIRTYSSGMLARLGFSVATCSQPDILIVDEILSVGDELFQRKSFERIQHFQARGSTILLVSHNRRTIESMCDRVAWLDHGRVKALGSPLDVLSEYHEFNAHQVIEEFSSKHEPDEEPEQVEEKKQPEDIEIIQVQMVDENGAENSVFHTGQPITVKIKYFAHKRVKTPIYGIGIHRQDGTHITGPNTGFSNFFIDSVEGKGEVSYQISALPLLEGLYHLSAAVVSPDDFIYDYQDRSYPFRIVNVKDIKEQYGIITLNGSWSHHT